MPLCTTLWEGGIKSHQVYHEWGLPARQNKGGGWFGWDLWRKLFTTFVGKRFWLREKVFLLDGAA